MAHQTDFLVIGSGVAGLSYALQAAEHGTVAIVTKRSCEESNTHYAQGGIASVWDDGDSFESHIRDTLVAGAGLCRRDAVEVTVSEGPAAIKRLIDWGVRFSHDTQKQPPQYDLGREGGHSHRRILHAKDMTGAEIEHALISAVSSHPNIKVVEHHVAVDLVTRHRLRRSEFGKGDRCLGAYVLNTQTGQIETWMARVTLLATGGSGKVYLYTSNPDVATGDGVAMAFRAGAAVANMEFIQFHPTCLYHANAKSFLISEALRGEGGILRRRDGTPFMQGVHPMADLAPRDIVARAIDRELKQTGDDCVFLDMTHKDGDFILERFPTIFQRCMSFGIDIRTMPIPIVPAAHYQCGGVLTNLYGETGIPGLFVCGEVACTGLHGANRLASNSLLEAVVFSQRALSAGLNLLGQPLDTEDPDVPPWVTGFASNPDEAVVISQSWDEIRRFMWNYVGIVRSNGRLMRAQRRIALVQTEIREDYWKYYLTRDLVELRNLATVASLIIESALSRQESRGLHYNADYPETDDVNWCRETVLRRGVRS
ncbi:MAG: L-aspartate oxidase [Myxococcales bacterium]|nr:L-aspartate oxidase [Myxococcales bacterium]